MSAVGPPGADAEIPHVAGIADDEDAGLPPGERCYSCDVDKNGIPLERRLSDQRGRRYRRRANYTLPLLVTVSKCPFGHSFAMSVIIIFFQKQRLVCGNHTVVLSGFLTEAVVIILCVSFKTKFQHSFSVLYCTFTFNCGALCLK